MSREQEVNFLKRDDPADLGLNPNDIKVVRHALQRLQRHPGYPQGYDIALKQVLDEQDRVASLREIEHLLKRSQVAITRRSFLKLGLKLGRLSILGAAGVALASAINQSCLSPEAVARRAEEDKRNQEANQKKQEQDRLDKIKAENDHALGLTPSAISYGGFRFHYNPVDKNVRYVEIGGDLSYFTVRKGDFVNWDQKKNDGNKVRVESCVFIDTYTRVQDGKRVPKLVSRVNNSVNEAWYLRDQPAEDIDTSVVVFEDVKNRREYIYVISSLDDLSNYQFRLMRKEVADNKSR